MTVRQIQSLNLFLLWCSVWASRPSSRSHPSTTSIR